jgi:maltoporin
MKSIPNKLAAALLLAGMLPAAHALDLTYSGYIRGGTGINLRGGVQTCFGLGGADSKFRLGNECDYVIEPNFRAKLTSYEGADWFVHVMPSVYRAWGQEEGGTDVKDGSGKVIGSSGGSSELITRFGQVYAGGEKIKELNGGSVWAGKRFFNRLQTGINDQFLENHDGQGGGVENIDLGGAKLSAAFMLDPLGSVDSANNKRYSIPVAVTDIKTNADGALSVYVTPSAQTKSKDQAKNTDPASEKSGIELGVYHKQGNLIGGNLLAGLKFEKQGEVKSTRIVAQWDGKIAASTQLDVLTEFRVKTAPGKSGNKWFALGARTDTSLGGPFHLLLEAGHDRVKPEDGSPAQTLTKLTVAGAMSAGPDPWSRPTVRLFMTHALWNEAARTSSFGGGWVNQQRAAQVFGDKKSGTSIGVQAETWW